MILVRGNIVFGVASDSRLLTSDKVYLPTKLVVEPNFLNIQNQSLKTEIKHFNNTPENKKSA